MNYADFAPAFVAARAGYDVWMGNSRGSTYSRRHVLLDPDHDKKKFFDYSFTDMGKYDLPAVTDMIQNRTGHQKVAYIGHSLGTTSMFSAIAKNPDYWKDKVSLFVALNPLSMFPHTEAHFFHLARHLYDRIVATANLLGMYEVGGSANWFTEAAKTLGVLNPELLKAFASLFLYNHPEFDDESRTAVYVGHSPNGASIKTIKHLAQNMIEARF